MWKEKTTWVGLIAILIVIALVTAYIMGKVDAEGVAVVGGMVVTALGGVLMWFAKDKTKAATPDE